MKGKFGILIGQLVALPIALQAQISEVTRAVREGNAALIAEHLSSSVEVSTPAFTGNCGQRQAREILSGFFSSQRPAELIQKSLSENNGARHYIGHLRTQNGATYRVIIHTLRDAQSQREMVRVIRFENER